MTSNCLYKPPRGFIVAWVLPCSHVSTPSLQLLSIMFLLKGSQRLNPNSPTPYPILKCGLAPQVISSPSWLLCKQVWPDISNMPSLAVVISILVLSQCHLLFIWRRKNHGHLQSVPQSQFQTIESNEKEHRFITWPLQTLPVCTDSRGVLSSAAGPKLNFRHHTVRNVTLKYAWMLDSCAQISVSV